ncbi:MAG: helix-turn-helix domain-containing protein, partial [Chloroflexi bacterium]|nr:helix-turn-helix domain-containing protein [Chloroflexota bacterium]
MRQGEMRGREFLDQVRRLGGEGKSIRVIAAELGVHRSRVHRALKALAQTTCERP